MQNLARIKILRDCKKLDSFLAHSAPRSRQNGPSRNGKMDHFCSFDVKRVTVVQELFSVCFRIAKTLDKDNVNIQVMVGCRV